MVVMETTTVFATVQITLPRQTDKVKHILLLLLSFIKFD